MSGTVHTSILECYHTVDWLWLSLPAPPVFTTLHATVLECALILLALLRSLLRVFVLTTGRVIIKRIRSFIGWRVKKLSLLLKLLGILQCPIDALCWSTQSYRSC
jgi:hypothetical protein